MKLWAMNCASCVIGIISGSLSGYSLIQQVTTLTHKRSRNGAIYPIIRMLSIGLLGLIVLRWGSIPFILYSVSTLLTMWSVIVTYQSRA